MTEQRLGVPARHLPDGGVGHGGDRGGGAAAAPRARPAGETRSRRSWSWRTGSRARPRSTGLPGTAGAGRACSRRCWSASPDRATASRRYRLVVEHRGGPQARARRHRGDRRRGPAAIAPLLARAPGRASASASASPRRPPPARGRPGEAHLREVAGLLRRARRRAGLLRPRGGRAPRVDRAVGGGPRAVRPRAGRRGDPRVVPGGPHAEGRGLHRRLRRGGAPGAPGRGRARRGPRAAPPLVARRPGRACSGRPTR